MTTLLETFTAPFRIEPVLTQGVDRPAIFVLKDGNGAALGGFQDEAIGGQVVAALNAYSALREALGADPRLARQMKRALRKQAPGTFAPETP